MKEVPIHIEPAGDGFWAFQQRSAGKPPGTPLHVNLKWILQQLDFGNSEWEEDQSGETVSLVLGRKAAPQEVSQAEVSDHVRKRLMAVSIAGVIARSRESGTSPTKRYADFVRQSTLEINESGHRNTEIYYALELVKILGRISKKIFKLEAPPVGAPDAVVWYLREATHCWLYGLHSACIALCRACLEDSLKTKLGKRELVGLERQSNTGTATLEMLIARAYQLEYLDGPRRQMAANIRTLGNDMMHGNTPRDVQSTGSLDGIRSIVECFFAL